MRGLVPALATAWIVFAGHAVLAQQTPVPAHLSVEDRQEQIVLTGTIQTAEGDPIPQATVYLFSRFPSELMTWKRHGDGKLRDPFDTSDDHGSFTLTAKPDFQYRFFFVQADGYAETFHPVKHPSWTPDIKENTSHTITLHRAITMEGTVFGDGSNPLPGATVNAYPATLTHPHLANVVLSSATTDGNGRFKLQGMPETSVTLNVSAPGYADETAIIRPGETPQIRLNRGQTVRGRAVDLDDNPVAGIRLALSRASSFTADLSKPQIRPFTVSWNQQVITGDNGEFTFLNVPYGDYNLGVSQVIFHNTDETTQPSPQHLFVPGGVSNSMPVAVEKRVPQHPLTARVYDGYTIEGQVVDKTTNSPVADATVTVWGNTLLKVSTDHEGRFTVRNLFTTSTQVTVEAHGYLFDPPATSETVHLVNHTPVTKMDLATSGTVGTAIFPMVKEKPVTGRVIDAETSRPIPSARVNPVPSLMFAIRSDSKDTVSKADGTFSIDLKQPGRYPLKASADGYAPGFSRLIERGFPDEVTILMHPGVTVRGQVFSSDGQPVAGATIWPLATFETPPNSFPMPIRELLTTTTTSADGHFLLENLPPNVTTILRASADRHAPSVFHEMNLKADQPVPPVVLNLRKPGLLAGRLVQSDGTPASQNHLMAYNESGEQEVVQTDDQGQFRFTELPEGTYTIQPLTGSEQNFSGIETGRDDIQLKLSR